MSLRPIDLQVILNQMGEVSKNEKNRQNKRTEEKIVKDKKIIEKTEDQGCIHWRGTQRNWLGQKQSDHG